MNDKGVRIGFLALCGLLIVCMSVLIGLSKDGAITNTLLGVSAAVFGANFWTFIKGSSS